MRVFLALVGMLLAFVVGVFVEHDFGAVNLAKVGINSVAQRPVCAVEEPATCTCKCTCVNCQCDCKDCDCCAACPSQGGVGKCKCKKCNCCKACPGQKK